MTKKVAFTLLAIPASILAVCGLTYLIVYVKPAAEDVLGLVTFTSLVLTIIGAIIIFAYWVSEGFDD